jgi:hypothetical protein
MRYGAHGLLLDASGICDVAYMRYAGGWGEVLNGYGLWAVGP